MAEIMNEELLLTQEGYDKIVKEHEELVSVKKSRSCRTFEGSDFIRRIFLKMQSMILRKMNRLNWKKRSISWKR